MKQDRGVYFHVTDLKKEIISKVLKENSNSIKVYGRILGFRILGKSCNSKPGRYNEISAPVGTNFKLGLIMLAV